MKYNPDLHNRHSIRLRDHNYASTGAYFVTICLNERMRNQNHDQNPVGDNQNRNQNHDHCHVRNDDHDQNPVGDNQNRNQNHDNNHVRRGRPACLPCDVSLHNGNTSPQTGQQFSHNGQPSPQNGEFSLQGRHAGLPLRRGSGHTPGTSTPGFDFPTLGTIENDAMNLNDFGKIVEKYILEIKNNTDKFSNVKIGEYAIMPDHVHVIVGINRVRNRDRDHDQNHVGDIQNRNQNHDNNHVRRGRPACLPCDDVSQLCNDDTPLQPSPQTGQQFLQTGQTCLQGRHAGLPLRRVSDHTPTPGTPPAVAVTPVAVELGTVVQWIKTMTTNEYAHNVKTMGWLPFGKKLWQRNYYERVVRDDAECARIEKYIRDNPVAWKYSKPVPHYSRSKLGFTLIELLVYMAIMGFIIVVAGRAFSDSTSMRVRSQNMLASAEEAGRVAAILKEDISQMGAKSWVNPNPASPGGGSFEEFTGIYNNAAGGDYSSYILDNSDPEFDVLTFKKVYYTDKGVCGDIMTVKWSVAGKVLYRECSWSNANNINCQTASRDNNACPNRVEIARDVSKFKFLPSRPLASSAASDLLFPPVGDGKAFSLVKTNTAGTAAAFPNATNTRYTLCGFSQSIPPGTSGATMNYTNFSVAEKNATSCKKFTFNPGEEYTIDFELPCGTPACANSSAPPPCLTAANNEHFNPMTLFQPESDHLSVGLRNGTSGAPISTTANPVPDFLFYPPYDKDGKKAWHFEFSVPEQAANVCIGITGAFYSPAFKGYLDIENFTVSRKTDNVYKFTEDDIPTTNADKTSVKAFKLTLGIEKKGGGKGETNITETVIPVPNNGILPPGVV